MKKIAISQSISGVITQYQQSYGEDTPIVLIKEVGLPFEDWEGVVIFKAIGQRQEDGRYTHQLNTFSEDGFTGHSLFQSLEAAVEFAVNRGYSLPDPQRLNEAVKSLHFLLNDDDDFKGLNDV